MLSPRWHKVVRDLWLNKTRTMLVVLSIAIGVFALGTIINARYTLTRDLSEAWAAANPASATITTLDDFDDDMVQTVRRMRNVGEAEGRRNAMVRVKVGLEDWRDIQIFAVPDYHEIRVSKFTSEEGAWPPPKHAALIERGSLPLTGKKIGDTITVKAANGKEHDLQVAGLVHDITQMPSFLDGSIYAYVTFDTLEWLGESREYNQLYFTVAQNYYDKDHVQQVANEVRDKIEKSGRTVFFVQVADPGKHPLDSTMQTLLLLLTVLGGLSLILSGFLVVNTITALMAQQVRQIGIMKAVGAQRGQIAGIYFASVLVPGLLSLVLAVPLGIIGTKAFAGFMAGLFNFDLTNIRLPAQVFLLQAAVGVMAPVLSAAFPVITGTRVSAREAMSDYGLGQGYIKRGLLDRVMEHIRGLSRPVLLSLRNTFRRKGRLALTLITLILGGSIFISVFSVRDSLLQTLSELMSVWRSDVWVILDRPYRINYLTSETEKVPGVVAVEAIGFMNVRLLRADDTEGKTGFLMAVQPGTELMRPVISEGRWLRPEDDNEIVATTNFLQGEPDLGVGSEVTFKIDGRDTKWRIVGITKFLAPFVYSNYPAFARAVHEVGRAFGVMVVSESHDLPAQLKLARNLESRYQHLGLRVSSITKIAEERQEAESSFNIIVVMLLIMAVLLAVVGGLGLMGTMSINVLERTREIGVMRAIGASDGSVVQVFMIEGMVIGTLSWLVSALIAMPMSKLLSNAVGMAFMQSPLAYSFSVQGLLLWLGVVLFLSALASYLPARGASRVTVREVLAYE